MSPSSVLPESTRDASSGLPTAASGKSGIAPPKVTGDDTVELKKLDDASSQDKLPLHEDVMQLARLGDIGPIQKLFEEGKYKATYKDEEGITPLHWAAINNHYALCKFLVESGADVNAKGGESVATPAMWAAQRCRIHIVKLLIDQGADLLLTDGQGYNLLHLATFDGNVFQLLLLLHQNIPLDGPDPSGHTCLMWAAYNGYPACVELFLQWGASVNIADTNGFTALHWALVKGNYACIQKLIEHGSDRFAETQDGKTPGIVAQEMKSRGAYHRALRECALNSDGTIKPLPLPYTSFIRNRKFLNRIFFLLPFFLLVLVLSILSRMPIFAAVPIAIFLAYSLQWVAQQVLQWAPSDMKHIQRTPYLAGVFAATLFWVGVRWLTTILTTTYSSHPIYNLLFGVVYILCTWFYAIAMVEDPGYVPKLGSRAQQKAVIDDLLALWNFNEQNFCVHCMVRRPLRSKHCKRCSRCVAKHDHHCPWIHNCVGANNLRHFVSYVISLEAGAILFIWLAVEYIRSLPEPENSQCNILSEKICQYLLRDTFTVALSIWTGLQLVWVSMLMIVQLVQIARAMTTYESMRGQMHGSSQAAEAITSALTAGSTSMEGAQLTGSGMGPNPAGVGDHHTRRPKEGCFSTWKKLLGLDTFMATATGSLEGTDRRRRGNPYSRGIMTNCKDFWCDPSPYFGKRENGVAMLDGDVVNYTRIYEVPPRMKMRRPAQDGDEGLYHSIGTEDAV
ncbi:palmitoyltransferase akr1 [Lecanora helva]